MIRELDTASLLALEHEALTWNFSQRLSEEWVARHVSGDRPHAAQVALEVAAQKVPARPSHWRLLVLLTMQDGRVALSLLDVVPSSFLERSKLLPPGREQPMKDAMAKAISVAEWERGVIR